MARFRFTQFHFNGQEIAVDAETAEEARQKILDGEGETVGDEFFVRGAEEHEMSLELMPSD